jgi:hypothetical protein
MLHTPPGTRKRTCEAAQIALLWCPSLLIVLLIPDSEAEEKMEVTQRSLWFGEIRGIRGVLALFSLRLNGKEKKATDSTDCTDFKRAVHTRPISIQSIGPDYPP